MTARKTKDESQSWDDFWVEVTTGRTEVIRGVKVQVPNDMPLIVEERVEELKDSSDMKDVAELVALIFGTDCMEQWRNKGMGLREFQTVLTWGLAHAGGKEMSFAEALELVEKGDGAGKPLAPKGPNRAARRAQSAGGGGPSKRTSSVSTTSARKRSHT